MTILTMKGSYGMVWVSIYSVNYNNTVQMSEDFHQKKNDRRLYAFLSAVWKQLFFLNDYLFSTTYLKNIKKN